MHVSILDDIRGPCEAKLLCSGANSLLMTECFSVCAAAKSGRQSRAMLGHRRRKNMTTLRINADEVLWRNSMLPESILEAGSSPTATPRTPATLSRRSGSKARCTISSHRSVKMAASEAGRWNLALGITLSPVSTVNIASPILIY
jgi:hypothetical protein